MKGIEHEIDTKTHFDKIRIVLYSKSAKKDFLLLEIK